MLLLLLSGLCFFLTLGFGSVFLLFLFPVLFFKFPLMVAGAFEFIISLAHFYGEILFFMIGIFLDITQATIHLCFNIAPFVHFASVQILNAMAGLYDTVRYQIGPQVWNFAQQQTEIFLFFWGLVVTSVYAFFNSLTVPDGRDIRVDGRDNENEDEDYRDHFVEDVPVVDRQRQHERNRLYPDLNDMYAYEELRQDQDNGYQERTCVVCFERDRNAAVFPCGHTQTCLPCTRQIMHRNARCPICQRRITEIRQVFV